MGRIGKLPCVALAGALLFGVVGISQEAFAVLVPRSAPCVGGLASADQGRTQQSN